MSRRFTQSLKFSLAAVIALAAPLALAQPHGVYPGWGGEPQGADYGGGANPWNSRAEQANPANVLRDVVGKLTHFLESKPNSRALAAYVEQEVVPWFDFEYMAQWAAGRRFNQMDEASQDELAARIKDAFLKSMMQKLARYSQQRAIFLAPQSDDSGEVTLPIAIENPSGGYPARLEFHMRQTYGGWKVIDVSANGMSALIHYRQMINEMQQRQPRRMAPPMQPY